MGQTFPTFPTSCLLPREPGKIGLKKQRREPDREQLTMQALIEHQCVPNRDGDTIAVLWW